MEEEKDAQPVPGQEEDHEEKPQSGREIDQEDQEVKVTTEAAQPQRPALFSFQPINPNNVRADENEKEPHLEQNFP